MARKRRGRGEGSVYKRSDGIWTGSVSVGYHADGKRRRVVAYGATKREVQENLRELQSHQIDRTPEAKKITVAEFLIRWLETTAKPNVAATTHRRYEQLSRLHLVPYLGGMKVVALTPMHVEQLFVEQDRKGVSVQNRAKSGALLREVLGHAVRLGIVEHNPCLDVKKPRPAKQEMKFWTLAEAVAFLDAAEGDRLHALYQTALDTGMRSGELFGLLWGDVDFDRATIVIQRTLEEVGGKLRLKEPKTPHSRRNVTLSRHAADTLRDHRKQMLADGHAGGGSPVFCDAEGGFLRRPNVARRSFHPLIEAAAVPRIRFHDLRHTAATLMLLGGVNIKVVSERLGHASIEITLSTYAHVLPNMQTEAAEKMNVLWNQVRAQ